MDAAHPRGRSAALTWVRDGFEVVFPGFVIGLVSGGLVGALGALGGLSAGQALATALTLGIPLGIFGATYDALLATGRVRIGTLAPAVAFWLPLFPLARLIGELLSDVLVGSRVALPEGLGPFLAYQALLSLGYAIGFVFLHEQIAPLWWLRVRRRNPAVGPLVERYVEHADAMHRSRPAPRRRTRRQDRHDRPQDRPRGAAG